LPFPPFPHVHFVSGSDFDVITFNDPLNNTAL
jgi:hypothetical protein